MSIAERVTRIGRRALWEPVQPKISAVETRVAPAAKAQVATGGSAMPPQRPNKLTCSLRANRPTNNIKLTEVPNTWEAHLPPEEMR